MDSLIHMYDIFNAVSIEFNQRKKNETVDH